MFDAKYSISYLQFVRVSYEEAGKTISYFTRVDAHFTSRFFDQFFRAKKKNIIDRISFFFRSSCIKKTNKRIEISTPSSRYLLQKQVQSCDIIQPKRILFFEMNIIETRLLWGYAKCIRIFVRYLYVIGEFYFIQTVE